VKLRDGLYVTNDGWVTIHEDYGWYWVRVSEALVGHTFSIMWHVNDNPDCIRKLKTLSIPWDFLE